MDCPPYRPEFGRFDLALGTVIGLRSFHVEADGTLAGIVHRDVWVPGENHATCHNRPSQCSCGGMVGAPTWSALVANGVKGLHEPECTNETPCAPDESIPTPGCRCGFYAYTQAGTNDYGTRRRVSGIVEGWGRTIVGTRGFRAQKARILALCLPLEHLPVPLKFDHPGPPPVYHPAFTEEQRAGIFRLYPDVRIYKDFYRMVFDFPLSDNPSTELTITTKEQG